MLGRQAEAGFECRGSSGKDISYTARTTKEKGGPVTLLSLVSAGPQAIVAGFSKVKSQICLRDSKMMVLTANQALMRYGI